MFFSSLSRRSSLLIHSLLGANRGAEIDRQQRGERIEAGEQGRGTGKLQKADVFFFFFPYYTGGPQKGYKMAQLACSVSIDPFRDSGLTHSGVGNYTSWTENWWCFGVFRKILIFLYWALIAPGQAPSLLLLPFRYWSLWKDLLSLSVDSQLSSSYNSFPLFWSNTGRELGFFVLFRHCEFPPHSLPLSLQFQGLQ